MLHRIFIVWLIILGWCPLTLAETNVELALKIKNEGGDLLNQGRYAEAVEKYRESMAINPDYIANYYNLGTAYAHLGKKEEALSNFNQAIEKGYRKPRLYYNMGFFLVKWGQYEDGIKNYEKVYAHFPKDYSIILNLSLAYKKANRLDEAKALTYRGLRQYPGDMKLLKILDNINKYQRWNS